MFDEIKNILFSNKNLCYICREEKDNKGPYICLNCYENLEIVNGEIDLDSPYIEKLYYSLFYNRFIRDKISDYKFNEKNYLCRPFGQIIVDTAREKEIHKDIDLIFYIPSHRRKEALRGYNQGELLGQYISKALKIPLSKGNLVKVKNTKDQSGLNKLDRRLNLDNSFEIREPKEIRGKKILLIDDIITTGRTLEESSKVLIENGVEEIIGLTLTSTKI